MSTPPKTRTKKLHGQDKTVEVDLQILRWRQRLRKEGLILGKKAAKAETYNRKQRKEREVATPEKLIRKKWFT